MYTLALSFVVFSPSFLGNMCRSRGAFTPECLHCVLWGAYTACSGVLILRALGYLHCVPWGTYTVFPGVLTMRALGCLHCVLWGAYTMSAGGMATYVTNG